MKKVRFRLLAMTLPCVVASLSLITGCGSPPKPYNLVIGVDISGSSQVLRQEPKTGTSPFRVLTTGIIQDAANGRNLIEVFGYANDTDETLNKAFSSTPQDASAVWESVDDLAKHTAKGRGTFFAPILRHVRKLAADGNVPTFLVLCTDGKVDDVAATKTEIKKLADVSAFKGLIIAPVPDGTTRTEAEHLFSPLDPLVTVCTADDLDGGLTTFNERVRKAHR